MTNTYFLANNSNPITLTVNISTPGIAFSEADKEIPGGSSQIVADSSGTATGNIKQIPIANADQLAGCVIEIDTIIELDTVDPGIWQSCYDNLIATYSFTGGVNGDVRFTCDSDDKKKSTSGKTVTIAKMIQLTAK